MSSSNTQDLPSLPSNGLMLTGSPDQLIETSELLQRYCRRKGPIRGFENVSDVAPPDSCHSSDCGGGRQGTGGVASGAVAGGEGFGFEALDRWRGGGRVEVCDRAPRRAHFGCRHFSCWNGNVAGNFEEHTLANQLRLGGTGFLHLDQHLPAAGRRARRHHGWAAPERGTFRISSTSHAAVAVEYYCFKSSSGVDSVVASSELGDDLAEPIGVLAQKG
jgi:hypothetical protein